MAAENNINNNNYNNNNNEFAFCENSQVTKIWKKKINKMWLKVREHELWIQNSERKIFTHLNRRREKQNVGSKWTTPYAVKC